ncbi:hypothetical protein ACH429_11060 [Streptomyces pathocidini]|uniref:DUF4232 domain-containing protein n=1 Tax=Streptomyces pathocidini TaxID=1650571 RepID=A0ABW7UPT4_9ACTN|nr:hypothetical protein [Streptomyces pathocidini]
MSKQHHGSTGPGGPVDPDRLDPAGELHRLRGQSGSGEQELRRLLHTAVEELQPSPDALDHLRRAVPARRARKRQALVGAAAAVILVGTAVPALVHVAQNGGVLDEYPANAGHSERAAGEASGGPSDERGGGAPVGAPSGRAEEERAKKGKGEKKDGASEEPGSTTVGKGADPSETMAATSPTCTRNQLTNGTSSPGTLDGSKTAYGSFRVANTSGTACAVDGGGLVLASAQGGSDAAAVKVVDHTAGDPATGLPDPATEPQQVILQPGAAYEVKYAWIPAEEGTGGCQKPGASPDPATSGSTEGAAPDGKPAAADTAAEEPAAPPTGSVELSHTPQAGDPAAASATISGACAGTVYRTGALATVK